MRLVLGVDSSTQSTKVEVRNLDTGRVVAAASSPHPQTEPPVSEQDPRTWWAALAAAVVQLGDIRQDIVAISVAGQQHGLVLLDDNGNPLRPAKLWNDTTSADQATSLVAELGRSQWAERCGSVPVASFTISKLAWVAANEPDLLDRIAMVMLPHDYLTWRLTGNHVTDRGDASGTGWFNPSTNEYDSALLGTVVDDTASWLARLPSVLGPSDAAGTLTDAAAATLGLRAETVVGSGTGDNMSAALGLGLETGDIAMSLGTSGTVYAVSSTPTADPKGLVAGFADAAGGFLPLVCTLNATKVTDTVAAWLGTDAAGLASLALSAGPEDGTVLLPYFDGERSPNFPTATGSFHGLTNTTGPASLARGAHDGVLCGLLDGLDELGQAGVVTDGKLNLIGGGARSTAYRQRLADLSGRTISAPDIDEAVATGACLQAATISGNDDTNAVARRWGLGGGTVTEPSSDASETRAAYAAARQALYGDEN